MIPYSTTARIPTAEPIPGYPLPSGPAVGFYAAAPRDARRPEPATPTVAAVREAARELATLILLARELVALLSQARELMAAVQAMTPPAGEQQQTQAA